MVKGFVGQLCTGLVGRGQIKLCSEGAGDPRVHLKPDLGGGGQGVSELVRELLVLL